MQKLTRKEALQAIRGAGARNDKQAFMRLYIENRISLAVANHEWTAGRKFATFIETRDATSQQET